VAAPMAAGRSHPVASPPLAESAAQSSVLKPSMIQIPHDDLRHSRACGAGACCTRSTSADDLMAVGPVATPSLWVTHDVEERDPLHGRSARRTFGDPKAKDFRSSRRRRRLLFRPAQT